jgi:hypothetical protein
MHPAHFSGRIKVDMWYLLGRAGGSFGLASDSAQAFDGDELKLSFPSNLFAFLSPPNL